jgi:hypothetical protein
MTTMPPHAPQPGYDQPPPAPVAAPKNGMGTAALVLGILAIVLAFIPILGFASWPLSILGVIFGLVGVRRVGKRRATNKGVAVSGFVLSLIGLVLVIISTVMYVSAIGAGVKSMDNAINAEHHVTYKVTTTSGGAVSVTYSQGRSGSGSVVDVPSPWSVDTTVTGSVATLTASAALDVQHPNRTEGITCSIVDADSGKTVATSTVPPSANATVSCDTTDLGSK